MRNSTDRYFRKVDPSHNTKIMSSGISIPSGVYLGIVVDNEDPNKLERVKVHISSLYASITPSDSSTNIDDFLGSFWCERLLSYGGTGYGMLGPAPAIGDEVIVVFSGDGNRGIVVGVIPNPNGTPNVGGPQSTNTSTGTYAPSSALEATRDLITDPPPEHPIAEGIREQGLDEDLIRGQNQSNIRRDPTPRVLGISTPTGHSIVMDDGSFESDEFNSIRIRTSGGAQILLDDNRGFIYVINRNGSAWFEMNRNGDFDIFSGGNINIHTKGEFNVHAGGNINMQADRNINIKSVGAEGVKIQASRGSLDFHAHANANITADENGNLRMSGDLRMSAGRIDLNGPPALAAAKPTANKLSENTGVTESITGRVPEREPWKGHLDQTRITTRGASAGQLQSDGGSSGGSSGGSNVGQSSDANYNIPAGETIADGLIGFGTLPVSHRAINPDLLTKLESIVKEYGKPITLISGKSPRPRTSGSKHPWGDAVDFVHRDGTVINRQQFEKLVELASKNGIEGIGVYRNDNDINATTLNFLHFSINHGRKYAWGRERSLVYSGLYAQRFTVPILQKYGYAVRQS